MTETKCPLLWFKVSPVYLKISGKSISHLLVLIYVIKIIFFISDTYVRNFFFFFSLLGTGKVVPPDISSNIMIKVIGLEKTNYIIY